MAVKNNCQELFKKVLLTFSPVQYCHLHIFFFFFDGLCRLQKKFTKFWRIGHISSSVAEKLKSKEKGIWQLTSSPTVKNPRLWKPRRVIVHQRYRHTFTAMVSPTVNICINWRKVARIYCALISECESMAEKCTVGVKNLCFRWLNMILDVDVWSKKACIVPQGTRSLPWCMYHTDDLLVVFFDVYKKEGACLDL